MVHTRPAHRCSDLGLSRLLRGTCCGSTQVAPSTDSSPHCKPHMSCSCYKAGYRSHKWSCFRLLPSSGPLLDSTCLEAEPAHCLLTRKHDCCSGSCSWHRQLWISFHHWSKLNRSESGYWSRCWVIREISCQYRPDSSGSCASRIWNNEYDLQSGGCLNCRCRSPTDCQLARWHAASSDSSCPSVRCQSDLP